MPKPKVTRPKATTKASQVLRNKSTGSKSKTSAGSVFSQTEASRKVTMNLRKAYFLKILTNFRKMNGLLIFDALESIKLIRSLTSTINSNIEKKPDGFNMVKSPENFNQIQSISRCFIRNFFAYVEGITYLMRYSVIEAHEHQIIQLENKIIAKLQEKQFNKDSNTIGPKNKFNSFRDNLNLSFNQFASAFGSAYKLNKNVEGWHIFLELLETRHQITHPKTPGSYILREKIIKDMHKGALWFTESVRELINSCAKALENKKIL